MMIVKEEAGDVVVAVAVHGEQKIVDVTVSGVD